MTLAALLLSVIATRQAAAQTQRTVAIPCERDTGQLAQAHPYNNDGAWGYLWIKVGNGENRIALGFDTTPLAGLQSNIVSAVIRLRCGDHTFTLSGTSFSIHAYNPYNQIDWIEGNDRFNLFTYADDRRFYRSPKAVGGPGITWRCEADNNPNDGKCNCLTPWLPFTTWNGGLAEPTEPVANLPRGFRTTASDIRIEKKGYDPLQAAALKCYLNGGGVDCWRAVDFDVTADIREFAGIGFNHPTWLIRRTPPASGSGGAHFFSREGAICIFGIPELTPTLFVTLALPADASPIVIPEPEPHCQSYTEPPVF